MTEKEFEVVQNGEDDVRKASANDSSIKMSVTGFAEPDEQYKLIKTEEGFRAVEI